MPGREKIENLLGFKAKRLKGKMNEYDAALTKVSELFTQDVHVKTLGGEEKVYSGYDDLSNGLSFQEAGSFLHPFSPKEAFSKKMKFFLFANGVEAKDILAYANDPESEKGKEVSEKVNSLKNDFFSIIYQGDDRKMGEYYGEGMKSLLQKSRQIYDKPMTYDSYSENFDIMYEIDGVKDYFSDLFADRIKSNFALLGFSEKFRNQGVSPDDMSEYFNFLEKPMRVLSEADKNDLSSLAEFHSSMNEVSSFMNSREHDENLSKDIININVALSEGKEEREKTFKENVSSLQSNDTNEKDDLLEKLYFTSVVAKEGKLLDNRKILEKVNPNLVFSDALKKKFERYGIEKTAFGNISLENIGATGLNADHRDFAELASTLLADADLESSQKLAKGKEIIDDFYYRPETREKYTQMLWNKLENINLDAYDLSCLSEEGSTDKSVDEEGLTKSERDLFNLVSSFTRVSQTFSVMAEKFPELYDKYSTDALERVQLLRNNNTAFSFNMQFNDLFGMNEIPLANNKVNVSRKEDTPVVYHKQLITSTALAENEAKIAKGMKPEEIESIISFDRDMEELKKLDPNSKEVGAMCDSEYLYCTTSISYLALKKARNINNMDIVYIDGISANDYFEKNFPEYYEGNSKGPNPRQFVAETNKLYLSGSHHIDVVSFHMDQHGEFKPVVNSYQHITDPEAKKFYKNDVSRDLRVNNILREIESKFSIKKIGIDDIDFADSLGKMQGEEREQKIKDSLLPKEKTKHDSQKSPEDVAKDLSDRLSAIDSPWYHINSKEYNNIIDALKNHPTDKAKIVECCNAYIDKYTNGTDGMNRVHDYGTKRMSLIYQISNTYQMDIKLENAKEESKNQRPADAEKIGAKGVTENLEGGKQVGTTTRELSKPGAEKTNGKVK